MADRDWARGDVDDEPSPRAGPPLPLWQRIVLVVLVLALVAGCGVALL
jgi:hypothetical protein